MEKNLYIDASHPNETRVVLKSGENIEDYEYEGLKNNLIKNNIYLGKVSRIEPSLQAAFVDFGRERHGFLSFNDIQSDYYQIPKADLERIKEEEEKAREELSREVEAKEEENIAEGKLEIDDPIEKISEEQIEEDSNNKENITEKENLDDGKEKKKEHRFKFKRYKIQEVIKPNQVILVQVIKDERGQKGAALSTFISIAGKYIVLMPNTPKGGGISRKIFNPGDRKKIRNILNDNFTYFYIKKIDSSRIYGLELEHITSPYNLNFILNKNTLIEEHISGIPGDDFFSKKLIYCNEIEKSQIAKEFVKFSERCMVRLLGDMRAYNYVIVPTHDFDQVVYKIRAIDFDQQCYEGDFIFYRPQLFKDNFPVTSLIKDKLLQDSINQYKIEERAIIVKRILGAQERIENLLNSMKNDVISNDENVKQLSQQIYHLTKHNRFKYCSNMGEIMDSTIDYLINNYENHEMLRTNVI